MPASSDERGPVNLLADEFLARCKRGERPTIKEYCDRHPDLADEIRDVFEALLMVEDLKPGSSDVSGSIDESVKVETKRLEQVGDYRILCEIGRGGMGVVYEAEQQALGRRVALKVLPRASAGDGSAQVRFQREAKAAARMHHTNIVPVFDVGQDGEHLYYAMQLIHGQGLDLVIADLKRLRAQSTAVPATDGVAQDRSIAASLVAGQFEKEDLAAVGPDDSGATAAYEGSAPSSAMLPGQSDISTATSNRGAYFRSVAQIGVQTASALSYAHSRGIIHRDIKPGNLILDTTGNVWVTDFGLAKTGDSAMTHTGDVLGTVRYMSPERFRGQCDVRADVYALGMTLYEMLTLKEAFASGDRLKLIELIRQTEAASPRSIDVRIPRDLETIVIKAIDKDSKRRYQSADEMAEDLQRFVNDEPIKARRIGVAERLTRWCRRNPAVASLTAAVLLLMAVGTAVSTRQALVATRAREDVAAKNRELAEEQAKVQARFELAQKAIALFHTGVSEDALLKNEQFKELRTKLLTEAASFYEDLEKLLAGQTDAKSRKALAEGYFQLAELTDKIGSKAEALAVHRKALALRRELASAEGADVETRLDVTRSLHAVGTLLRSTGERAAALSAFQEVRDLAAALEAESPTDAVRVQLAIGHNGIGFVVEDAGKLAEALDSYRKALAIYQKLPEAEQYPQPGFGPTFGLQLQAGTYMSIGFVLSKTGKVADGLETLRTASDILEKLANANPANNSVQGYLANSYGMIGTVFQRLGKSAEALEASRKALATWQKLVDHNPAVIRFQDSRLGSMVNLALSYQAVGRTQEAVQLHEETLQLRKAKLGPDHRDTLSSMMNLARCYLRVGRPRDAIQLCEQALPSLKAKMPDDELTMRCMTVVAIAYDATGRTKEALKLREETLQLCKAKLGRDAPDTLGNMVNLAIGYRGVGRLTDAIKLLEETLPVMKAKMPDHEFTFNCRNSLADCYVDAGRTQEAVQLHEETLQLRKAKLGPDHRDTLSSMVNLARCYLRVGRPRDAIQLCEQALPSLKAKMPDDELTMRCMTVVAIGYDATGRTKEALKLREETLQLCKAKLGRDAPDTLGNMVNLAISYRGVGRLTDAIKLLEEALPVMKVKMPDHQYTFNCMTCLASAYDEAGRTQEALTLREDMVPLLKAKLGPDHPHTSTALDRVSVAYLTVAAKQAWFGQEREWAATCEQALSLAQDTKIAIVAERVAKICSLRPSNDKRQQAALLLARRAVELGKGHRYLAPFQMALGMAEYRSGHFTEANNALAAAMETGKDNPYIAGTSAFYRALTLFRQGKQDKAKQLATQAAAKMKPLPKDDKNPLAGGANAEDLILWLAYKEAKDAIKFDEKSGTGDTTGDKAGGEK